MQKNYSIHGLFNLLLMLFQSLTFSLSSVAEIQYHQSNLKNRELQNINIDFSDPDSLDLFVTNTLSQEDWVTPPGFGFSPLSNYTFDDLVNSDKDIIAMKGINFDTRDRVTNVGYRTGPNQYFSTAEEYRTWFYSQSATFRNRYTFIEAPTINTDAFVLSSPGLPIGEWRYIETNGVIWSEISRIREIRFGGWSYVELVRNIKMFYHKGELVDQAIDNNGDIYFLGGSRGSVASGSGFIVSKKTLTQNVSIDCFGSNLTPINEDGTDPIICKQNQFSDPSRNTWALAIPAQDESAFPTQRPTDESDYLNGFGNSADKNNVIFVSYLFLCLFLSVFLYVM